MKVYISILINQLSPWVMRGFVIYAQKLYKSYN
jgi:hypothetical protein